MRAAGAAGTAARRFGALAAAVAALPLLQACAPARDQTARQDVESLQSNVQQIESALQARQAGVYEQIRELREEQARLERLIEGHCDERGTDEYNLALGERRALAVRRYLVALGALADHLHTISYGEEKPADPGHEESSWAKNRRSEFKVSAR